MSTGIRDLIQRYWLWPGLTLSVMLMAVLAACDLSDRIDDRDAEVSDLASRVTDAEEKLEDLRADLSERADNTDTELAGLATRLADAEVVLGDLRAGLSGRVDNTDAEVSDLTSRVADAEVELEGLWADLSGRVDNTDTEVSDLAARVADAEEELEDLRAELSGRLDSTDAEVSDLAARVADIEAHMEAMDDLVDPVDLAVQEMLARLEALKNERPGNSSYEAQAIAGFEGHRLQTKFDLLARCWGVSQRVVHRAFAVTDGLGGLSNWPFVSDYDYRLGPIAYLLADMACTPSDALQLAVVDLMGIRLLQLPDGQEVEIHLGDGGFFRSVAKLAGCLAIELSEVYALIATAIEDGGFSLNAVEVYQLGDRPDLDGTLRETVPYRTELYHRTAAAVAELGERCSSADQP